jgi:hypothetical protein
MKGRRHTPERLHQLLGEEDKLLARGHSLEDVACRHEIDGSTCRPFQVVPVIRAMTMGFRYSRWLTILPSLNP